MMGKIIFRFSFAFIILDAKAVCVCEAIPSLPARTWFEALYSAHKHCINIRYVLLTFLIQTKWHESTFYIYICIYVSVHGWNIFYINHSPLQTRWNKLITSNSRLKAMPITHNFSKGIYTIISLWWQLLS